jgi:hypothetical protein
MLHVVRADGDSASSTLNAGSPFARRLFLPGWSLQSRIKRNWPSRAGPGLPCVAVRRLRFGRLAGDKLALYGPGTTG